jgi:twitching motility protein PilT
MKTMDNAILDLFRQGIITRSTALEYAIEKDMLERYLSI